MFVQNKDLGFEEDHIVSMPYFLRDASVLENKATIRKEIARLPGVESASVCHHRPGESTVDFITVRSQGQEAEHKFVWTGIDRHFLSTFKVDLVSGQNVGQGAWRRLPGGDLEIDVLINETGARTIGWSPETAPVLRASFGGRINVIGVVKDYHNQSLHAGIIPMFLMPGNTPKVVYARVATANLSATMNALSVTWKKFLPDRPFEYEFLSDRFDMFYRSEIVLRKVFSFFSALAIIVSCLGSLGLAAYSARRRRKEIGIRKTLGADSGTIAYLLAQEFLVLVVVAVAIAAPLAWIFCSDWLNTFTYRIDIPVSAFVIAGLVTFGLVAVAVSLQTVRASFQDPVDALRYE